jgi:hypothetical protein
LVSESFGHPSPRAVLRESLAVLGVEKTLKLVRVTADVSFITHITESEVIRRINKAMREHLLKETNWLELWAA